MKEFYIGIRWGEGQLSVARRLQAQSQVLGWVLASKSAGVHLRLCQNDQQSQWLEDGQQCIEVSLTNQTTIYLLAVASPLLDRQASKVRTWTLFYLSISVR